MVIFFNFFLIAFPVFMKIKWWLPCSIEMRVKCFCILPTYGIYQPRLRNRSIFRYEFFATPSVNDLVKVPVNLRKWKSLNYLYYITFFPYMNVTNDVNKNIKS